MPGAAVPPVALISSFGAASFRALDSFFLFHFVFRLDGELNHAALAVSADDLRPSFRYVPSGADHVWCFQVAVSPQNDDGAFGVNFFHSAFNDGAFVVLLNVLGERIAFQLLDAQGDALALWVADRITVSARRPS